MQYSKIQIFKSWHSEYSYNYLYFRKADHWAPTLIMQMIPKHILGNIGNTFFKNVKTVMFLPDQSHALEILTNFLFRGMVRTC